MQEKKIKILRILNRLNLGGPTFNVIFLTKFISSKFETKLLAGIETENEESSSFLLKKYDVNFYQLKNMTRKISFINDLISLFKIIHIIHKFKPDIVHTHAAKSGFLGRVAAILTGVPFIFHTFHGHVFHSYFNKFITSFFICLEKILALKTTKIIAISDLQKQDLVNKFKICKSEKVKVVKLGIDLNDIQLNQKKQRNFFLDKYNLENTINIGIIGRLTKIKNQKFFLNLASDLLKFYPKKLKFFIIGDGEDKNVLKTECDKLNLSYYDSINKYDKKIGYDIFFTSWIKKTEEIYPGLDIVCNTSLNEGTPLSLIEAMAYKKATISFNIGGVPDIISHNYNGLIIDAHDKSDYLTKLRNLIDNPQKLRELGENGYLFVNKNYSYKTLTNEIESLYLNEINK